MRDYREDFWEVVDDRPDNANGVKSSTEGNYSYASNMLCKHDSQRAMQPLTQFESVEKWNASRRVVGKMGERSPDRVIEGSSMA